jgi:hypothetical protein
MSFTVQGPKLSVRDVTRMMEEGMRPPLIVYGHTCIGDHIICCGMYRVLAETWQINVMARPGHFDNLRVMLDDLDDAAMIEIPEDQMAHFCNSARDTSVLRVGFNEGGPFDRWKFDSEFYRQAGIDFRHRWDSFRIPDVPQVAIPDGDYVFVHERPDFFNARIPLPGERPNPNASIFAHRNMILMAKQIHCVSSSFAAFADCFDLSGTELHFYPFGRETPKHRNKWTYH